MYKDTRHNQMKLYFILLLLPVLVAYILYRFRKEYPVHSKGIILITGASTGIGRHAAEYLARKYEFIVLAGVRKESDADSIREAGLPNLRPIIVDVSDHESVVAASDAIGVLSKDSKLPFIGLVNNAGIAGGTVAEFQSLDAARKLFDVNYFGVLDITQCLLPLLRAGKGRIIMISSIAGFAVLPSAGVYSSSKFALEAYSDALRRELYDLEVSVSVIQPGFVKSSIVETATKKAQESGVSGDYSLYPKLDPKLMVKMFAGGIQNGAEPDVTSVAVEDAMVAMYPKTRYPVAASDDGTPAVVLSWIKWLLTDRIMDVVVDSDLKKRMAKAV